jgi:hypothetical protein
MYQHAGCCRCRTPLVCRGACMQLMLYFTALYTTGRVVIVYIP